jgi:type IV pilus assembly protein PilW
MSTHSLPSKRQHGFTIIELMVSITIALFITAGLAQIFGSMLNTFLVQNKFTQFEDNERLAMSLMMASIPSARYFANPVTNTAATALPATTTTLLDGVTFAAGQGVSGTGSGTGTGSSSDTIDIEYQTSGTDTLENCLGATYTTKQVVINSFAVSANNELTCSVNGAAAVPLISNVYSMAILYGVDTKGLGTTDTYMTATQVATATTAASCSSTITGSTNCWMSVRVIRVSLTMFNPVANTQTPMANAYVQNIDLRRIQ